jgi:hypothetical protein
MADLPYDVSRCPGALKPVCETCLRRVAKPFDGWVSYILPDPSDDDCSAHIKAPE